MDRVLWLRVGCARLVMTHRGDTETKWIVMPGRKRRTRIGEAIEKQNTSLRKKSSMTNGGRGKEGAACRQQQTPGHGKQREHYSSGLALSAAGWRVGQAAHSTLLL